MNNLKLLLYIDILGFSELVKNDLSRVNLLFKAIDNLNAHKHVDFKTIVFSDTILIFNKIPPDNINDRRILIMYACEFVQDLMHKCISLNISFRALLTEDEFYYKELRNLEAYYGQGLINAYLKESEINALGLFISNKLESDNLHFKTLKFDKNFNYVFLTTDIEKLCYKYDSRNIPLEPSFIDNCQEFPDIKNEIEVIRSIKQNIDSHTSSKIRGKYLQTYYFYQQRYEHFIKLLENNKFDYKFISPDADW